MGTVMKSNMNIALTKPNKDPLETLIKVFNEILERLKDSQQSLIESIRDCQKLRQNRKQLTKYFREVKAKFPKLSEAKQVELEAYFFKVIQQQSSVIIPLKEEVKRDYNFLISFILIREIKKTLSLFKAVHKPMECALYPNRSKEILSNPALYQQLVDAWGDLADED